MTSIASRVVISCSVFVALACGDDDDAPADCDLALDEWCDQNGCDGYQTRDEALATALVSDGYAWLGARSCDEGKTISLGDGLQGRFLTYAEESGELIGVLQYSDQVLPDVECDSSNSSAGSARTCDRDACDLLVRLLDDDDVNACTGAVSEPFIAACMEAPSEWIQGCEACACVECYPALLQCARLEQPGGGSDACEQDDRSVECVDASCADECASQLQAIADG